MFVAPRLAFGIWIPFRKYFRESSRSFLVLPYGNLFGLPSTFPPWDIRNPVMNLIARLNERNRSGRKRTASRTTKRTKDIALRSESTAPGNVLSNQRDFLPQARPSASRMMSPLRKRGRATDTGSDSARRENGKDSLIFRRRTSWIESRQERTRWRWTTRPKKLWKSSAVQQVPEHDSTAPVNSLKFKLAGTNERRRRIGLE